MIRSMQNARPSTNAKATSDMKPALPSMNFTFSDWCNPTFSSVSGKPKSALASCAASVSGIAVAVSLACVCVLSVFLAEGGVGFWLLACALSSPTAAKSSMPTIKIWLSLCFIDVIVVGTQWQWAVCLLFVWFKNICKCSDFSAIILCFDLCLG